MSPRVPQLVQTQPGQRLQLLNPGVIAVQDRVTYGSVRHFTEDQGGVPNRQNQMEMAFEHRHAIP